MLKKFIKYYLPAIIWAGVIFYLSSIPELRYFPDTYREIILRKGAHLAEYAILAFLIWRLFYNGYELSIKKSFIYSLLIASLYAGSDELHQTFVFGRSGRSIDAAYDTISAFLGLELALIFILKKSVKKILFLILLAAAALALMDYDMIRSAGMEKTAKGASYFLESNSPANNNQASADASSPTSASLPNKIFIPVPFTSQAPLGVWDLYHEEACEEASIVMVKYYLDDKKLTPNIAEQQIQAMIQFEIKNYGDYKDTNAEKTAKLAKDFYGINNLKVVYDFTQKDLKKYLAEGKPIIIPAVGRMLGNPYYTPPGPIYHNLVLVGYNGNIIITNDPGTKRGEGYQYSINILYNAIHDFPGNLDNMSQGRKAMIVLE